MTFVGYCETCGRVSDGRDAKCSNCGGKVEILLFEQLLVNLLRRIEKRLG